MWSVVKTRTKHPYGNGFLPPIYGDLGYGFPRKNFTVFPSLPGPAGRGLQQLHARLANEPGGESAPWAERLVSFMVKSWLILVNGLFMGFFHGIFMDFIRSLLFSMGCYGIVMGLLWDFGGLVMGLLWFFYGILRDVLKNVVCSLAQEWLATIMMINGMLM